MREEEAGNVLTPAFGDGAEKPMERAAPGPQHRETPVISRRSYEKRPREGRGRTVFVDFGRNRVYALPEDGEEVTVFGDFVEMVEGLRPAVVVADSYPRKLLPVVTRLSGTTFLRLRDLSEVSEERRNNGLRKTNENDVKILRQIFLRAPDKFQPLYVAPEELTVRALTELWAQIAFLKKSSKQARTVTDHSLAAEIHKAHTRFVCRLAKEIHEEAMRLPLYRMAVERLGLKGPTLAYIVSHDGLALKTLSRDELAVRYDMVHRPWRGRTLRSRLLILLARAAIRHRKKRYYGIYDYYRRKGKRYWPAVLRVARRILRDIRRLTIETQEGGPAPA
jgi:hypothetical protein